MVIQSVHWSVCCFPMLINDVCIKYVMQCCACFVVKCLFVWQKISDVCFQCVTQCCVLFMWQKPGWTAGALWSQLLQLVSDEICHHACRFDQSAHIPATNWHRTLRWHTFPLFTPSPIFDFIVCAPKPKPAEAIIPCTGPLQSPVVIPALSGLIAVGCTESIACLGWSHFKDFYVDCQDRNLQKENNVLWFSDYKAVLFSLKFDSCTL